MDEAINFLRSRAAASNDILLKSSIFIDSEKVSTYSIITYNVKTIPVDRQTSVGLKFSLTYNFKIMDFFSIFNVMALLILWRLFKTLLKFLTSKTR